MIVGKKYSELPQLNNRSKSQPFVVILTKFYFFIFIFVIFHYRYFDKIQAYTRVPQSNGKYQCEVHGRTDQGYHVQNGGQKPKNPNENGQNQFFEDSVKVKTIFSPFITVARTIKCSITISTLGKSTSIIIENRVTAFLARLQTFS